jgi:hypothetical protein
MSVKLILSFQKLGIVRRGTSPQNQLSGIHKSHAEKSLVEISGSQISINFVALPQFIDSGMTHHGEL